jgi:hypothetical protein
MSDEIVENLKKTSAWLRVLFMAVFVIALYVAGVVLLVLMLAQIVFSLVTGADNTNLRRLGASLSEYVAQILAFLTYNSEERPFPFAQFPLSEPAQQDLWDDLAPQMDASAEPVNTEPMNSEAEPANSKPADSKPAQSKPAQSKSAASEKTAAIKQPGKSTGSKNTAAAKSSAPRARSAAKPAASKTASGTSSTSSKSAVKKTTAKQSGTGGDSADSKSNE